MEYQEFLKTKQLKFENSGFEIDKFKLNPAAFEWQKDIICWALKKGKSALFEDCGLGKTLQQLMWADAVNKYTGNPILIFAPLAVTNQTVLEGEKFGYEVNIIREQSQIINGINITNYEIAEHFDLSAFSGVVLDESSILKNYTSSTKEILIEKCAQIPYRLCCTATPSPNDFMELGNHSEFLGIMSRTEMLATYFVHDGGETSKWRLKGHAESKFFEWVASWACCLTNPADLGYDGTDYILPPLNIIEHIVKCDNLENDEGQVMLMAETSQSLSERRIARRNSLQERAKQAADIVNNINSQCLVWCDLNDESALLTELIDGAIEVKGDNKPEYKVEMLNGFSKNNFKCLVSKPKIAAWGMNWQQCNEVIFVGLSDSFEAYYQAIRRCWRFGQTKPVNVHIVISDAEGAVKTNIERKQNDAQRMTQELVKFTKDILTADIHKTIRITEKYTPKNEIIIPEWLKSEVINYECA